MTEVEPGTGELGPTTPPAPRHWEADVLLRDGRTAHIRPMQPADRDLLIDFYGRVSDESKYYRFFAPMPHLSERDVARFTQVDHVDRVAFVMTVAEQMIGVGRYDMITDAEAEVAFLVEDQHQGRGVAQLLLEHLAQAGRERGIETFTADVLPDKDAFVVVYCANTPCQNSVVASRRLVELGYTNVHEYVEGKQDWIEAGLPVESTVTA